MAVRIISRLIGQVTRGQVPMSVSKLGQRTLISLQLTNHVQLHRTAFARFQQKDNSGGAMTDSGGAPTDNDGAMTDSTGTPTGNIKTNIIAAITQGTTSVTLDSLLYQMSTFHNIIDCMLELDFKEDQVIDLFLSTPQLLNCTGEVLEDTIRFFRGEGFSVRQTLLLLKRSPGVVGSRGQVSELIYFLRDEIKLPDSNLQEVLTSHPKLLFSSADDLASNFKVLMDVFRRSDILRMIRKDPLVLLQTASEVDAKVNYIYHKMGQDQVEMVWANILCYNIDHIRARHELMARIGRFEKPDRKGVTRNPNPYLKDVLSGTDARFAKLAGITLEEYEVFKKLLQVEKETRLSDFKDELNEGIHGFVDEDEDGEEGNRSQGYRGEIVRRERLKKRIID